MQKLTDWNDLHLSEGLDAVKAQLNSPQEAEEADAPKKAKNNLERVLRQFDETHQYKMLGGSKICYRWTGTHYVEFGDQYVRHYAQENLVPKPEKKSREEFLDRVHISNLMDPLWFDQTTNRHINFINGVLNIDSGKLTAHSPERGFRYVLNYKYDAGAGCPTFDAMMDRITCKDSELAKILDEYMGYALSFDRYWYHKVLVLTGIGENGKSTWMDVLKSLAGEGNYSSLFLKDLNHEGNRQMLDGKLFNVSPEVPKKGLFDTSMFKALSSGDEVQARMIYKRPYTMKSRAKLIFACNELPDSADTTQGFYRRLIIVPFNATFSHGDPGYDPHIKEKLMGELSGIFNRAFAGYRRLCQQKAVTEARASHTVMAQYKMDNDSAVRWISENLNPEPLSVGHQYFSTCNEIYGEYAQEMMSGQIKPISIVDFGRKMSRVIPDYPTRCVLKKIDKKVYRVVINSGFHIRKPF